VYLEFQLLKKTNILEISQPCKYAHFFKLYESRISLYFQLYPERNVWRTPPYSYYEKCVKQWTAAATQPAAS